MITPFYAALLSVLLIVLILRVVGLRRSLRVGIGDGGNRVLARAIRVHANFVETVPWALMLMLLMEMTEAIPSAGLHFYGGVLCLARLAHAWGLTHHSGTSIGRVGGTVLTVLLFLFGAVVCLWQFFTAS